MRQEVTRAHKGWALDSVVLFNEVTKHFKEEITSAPAGIYTFSLTFSRFNHLYLSNELRVIFDKITKICTNFPSGIHKIHTTFRQYFR